MYTTGINLNASVCVCVCRYYMCTYQESLELFVWTLACNLCILSFPLYLHSSAVLPGLGFVSQCLALATSRIPPVCMYYGGCGVCGGPNLSGSSHCFTTPLSFLLPLHAWAYNSVSLKPWTLIILQQGNLNPIHQGKGQELGQTPCMDAVASNPYRSISFGDQWYGKRWSPACISPLFWKWYSRWSGL